MNTVMIVGILASPLTQGFTDMPSGESALYYSFDVSTFNYKDRNGREHYQVMPVKIFVQKEHEVRFDELFTQNDHVVLYGKIRVSTSKEGKRYVNVNFNRMEHLNRMPEKTPLKDMMGAASGDSGSVDYNLPPLD